jgi:hypothetical protein
MNLKGDVRALEARGVDVGDIVSQNVVTEHRSIHPSSDNPERIVTANPGHDNSLIGREKSRLEEICREKLIP